MAHVMQAAQQARKIKLAIAEMDSSTAYIVYDFKQKFLSKGFREGSDSYYGKKGMMWWGAGVFIKPKRTLENVINSPSESTDKHYVEMDLRSEEARLWGQMEAVDTAEDETKYQGDEHKWGEGHEYVCQEDGAEQW